MVQLKNFLTPDLKNKFDINLWFYYLFYLGQIWSI
jgi:hypothetical protein